MLILHGLWLPGGQLALWAEDAERAAAPIRRRGRQPRQRPHPFAATVEELVTALDDAGKAAKPGSIVLRLPTLGTAPLPSPEVGLVEEAAKRGASVTLAEWVTPVGELDADEALSLLTRPGNPDLVEGADFRHWRAVAAFTADLVSRGRVLPVVAGDPGGPLAKWKPLVTGGDAGLATALARSMPPSARAQAPSSGASGASGASGSAGATLAGAIDDLVDAAARVALGNCRLASARRSTGMGEAVRAWLLALTGRDRSIRADQSDLVDLAARLSEWQRDAAGGQVRACFRLVEPPETEPGAEEAHDPRRPERQKHPERPWRIEFALQAADEPSLVVDAERIWQSRGALRALARHLEAPQETLLSELGRASRLWPELRQALRSARPALMQLDSAGALHFLRTGAGALAAAGFGVLLPSWWGRPRSRLGARLNATATRSGTAAPGTVAKSSGFGLDAVVDFRWELALGDEVLSEEELFTLADAKAPLVRLRGQWVELDHERLCAGLAHLAGGGQMTVGQVLRAALEEGQGPGGLPVVGVTASGALGDLLSGRSEQRLASVDAPSSFRGTLRPYQRRGLAWLTFLQSLGLGGVLADDMGLGKTIQILALIAADDPSPAAVRRRGKASAKADHVRRPHQSLLVCPMSLVGNWQREAARFVPHLRVHVHHGAERARGNDFLDAVRESDLVITTYALAARDAEELGRIPWHRMVLDEAQAIKNAATRQATAVRGIPARHRLALTGTPVENRLADLWSIMEFANPGLLGSAARFK
ncbi:MAG: DEAD/DEAH box helicase, partial [Micromonosporaceae bacterium]|nr:DEAD/DEAH box helicase [Micromonosporaceae bacterium]